MEWLKSLKPGDKVLIGNNNYGSVKYTHGVVKSISKQRGDITVTTGQTTQKFNSRGGELSRGGSPWSLRSSSLHQPTPELLAEKKRLDSVQRAKTNLYNFYENRNHVSDNDLVKVSDAIEETELFKKAKAEKEKSMADAIEAHREKLNNG